MVVGAGFGGLAVARGLQGEDVDVTLVDANNFHTFQPLLYQVATAGLDAENVAYADPRHRRGRAGVGGPTWTFRMARVVGVDARRPPRRARRRRRACRTTSSSSPPGPSPTTTARRASHEHTFPLKHLDDALALRAHVLDCFERAAVDPSLVADGVLDVVVCGGGPTGVEMAGGLHELYHKVLAKDFPQLPVRDGTDRRSSRWPTGC